MMRLQLSASLPQIFQQTLSKPPWTLSKGLLCFLKAKAITSPQGINEDHEFNEIHIMMSFEFSRAIQNAHPICKHVFQ